MTINTLSCVNFSKLLQSSILEPIAHPCGKVHWKPDELQFCLKCVQHSELETKDVFLYSVPGEEFLWEFCKILKVSLSLLLCHLKL